MSLIVIATKLSQPFDSINRYTESESDPNTVQINWSKWAQTIVEPPSDGLKRGQEIHVTDADVFGMSEKQIDDYLDFYQRTWSDDRDPKSMYFHLFSGLTVLTFIKLRNKSWSSFHCRKLPT
jgi:RNA polymerase I-specific transcription initiation factor RRN7